MSCFTIEAACIYLLVGADPGGRGAMDPQTAMFPIVNNSAKKLSHEKTLMASQNPVLDFSPLKSSSGSTPVYKNKVGIK